MSGFENQKGYAISSNYLYDRNDKSMFVAPRLTNEEKSGQKPIEKTSVKSTVTVPMVNPTSKSFKNGNAQNNSNVGQDQYISENEKQSEVNAGPEGEKRTVQQMKQSLPATLAKAGIKDEGAFKAEVRLKLSALAGKTTKEDFKELDTKLQAMMLGYAIEAVERCAKAQKDGKLKNVSLADAVAMDIAMMYNFITHDENGNEIDIKTMTPEQVAAKRKAIDDKYKKQRELRKAKINKLPENEKQKALEELDAELASYRKHMFQKLYKNMSFQSALELLLIVSVRDVGDAAQELMDYYPPEIRKEIANTMQTFESFKAYINVAKGRDEDMGDKAARIAFVKYHRAFASFKTKEELEEYMKAAEAFIESRDNGEFEELVYKATAMGVGEAVYANHEITSEDKNNFIASWVQSNNGFLTDTEMAQVETEANEYIEQYLEQHPEERETFQHAKSMKEIVEKTLGREFKPEKTEAQKTDKAEKSDKTDKAETAQTSAAEVQSFVPEVVSTTPTVLAQVKEAASRGVSSPIKSEQPKTQTEQVATVKKSPKIIAQQLLSGQIDEEQAQKDAGSQHEFIMMCAENPTLKAVYKNRIMSYIRSEKDEKKLQEIIINAPELALVVLSNMRGDKSELAQEVVGKHEVNSCTSMLLQKEIENEDAKGYIV